MFSRNITVFFLTLTFVFYILNVNVSKTLGQTPFGTFEFRHCPTGLISDAMYVGTDVTISKCVEMCALRPWCEALLYRRQVPLCELFSETGLKVLEKTEVAGYCQFLDKHNFSPEMARLRTRCKDLANQKCSGQHIACDLENNACVKPVCPIRNLTNGWLDGNMNINGSQKRINCNQHHVEVNGANITTCVNGTWTPAPKCIIVCPIRNLTNGWLDGNMNINGSQKRINCNQHHVEVNGANITTCVNGTWTPAPKCIIDRRMFIGVPGVGEGKDIADSWKNGTQTTSQLESCFIKDLPSCKTHFRDSRLDKWSQLGVQRVTVSMYKYGRPDAFVEFDGSTITSWFDKAKIISSSWSLTSSSKTEKFTLDEYSGRRFYILESWDDCTDPSYMIALTEPSDKNCPYEKRNEPYPVFLYSKLSGPGRPLDLTETEIADKLVIEVTYNEEYNP